MGEEFLDEVRVKNLSNVEELIKQGEDVHHFFETGIDSICRAVLTQDDVSVFDCFSKGTLVHTKDGFRNIEDIKEGELIWSWNEDTDEVALKPVIKTTTNKVDILIKLVIGQEEIETTPDHPFYSNGAWIDAGSLEVGDEIQLFDGTSAAINEIDFVIDRDGLEGDIDFSIDNAPDFDEVIDGRNPIEVFNFEVEENEFYFVTKLKILVHDGKLITM